MIFVKQSVFAQETHVKKDNLLMQELAKNVAAKRFTGYPPQKNTIYPKPFLLPQFYSSQLGFFCKQEIKFDKITKIPFRFRLGSVEECDRLEGKRK